MREGEELVMVQGSPHLVVIQNYVIRLALANVMSVLL